MMENYWDCSWDSNKPLQLEYTATVVYADGNEVTVNETYTYFAPSGA